MEPYYFLTWWLGDESPRGSEEFEDGGLAREEYWRLVDAGYSVELSYGSRCLCSWHREDL